MEGEKSMRNIFGWMGHREQHQALAEAQEHMDKVHEVVLTLHAAMAAYGQGQAVQEIYDRIHQHEQAADSIRRNLLYRLSEGLFLPPDREDLVHFVERIDDIADNAHAAGRLLLLLPEDVPQPLKDGLREKAELLVNAVRKLGEALRQLYEGEMKGAMDLCNEVEAIEQQNDRKKADLFRQIFTEFTLPPATLLLLRDLVDAMENTADKTEDSADQLRIIAVKYKA